MAAEGAVEVAVLVVVASVLLRLLQAHALCRGLERRFAANEALRRFLICKMEPEPYPDAHQRNCGSKNDEKRSGVENHRATSFTARTMRPFELFA
jgi:hypothetical protein